ncbi:MAG: hypothetical protein MJY67_03495 [Bacteroidales bacterium]|nr:hypothetical protein [Bacteroidales bacterium]
MKKTFSILCLSALILSACAGGNNNQSENNDEQAAPEAAAEFSGNPNSKEGVAHTMKNSFGVSLEAVAPDYEYNADAERAFIVERNLASASFISKEPIEEMTAQVLNPIAKKVYEATKAVSETGANVFGFEEKDTKDAAMAEKSFEQVCEDAKMMGFFIGSYQWGFVKNGKLQRCIVQKLDNGYSVTFYEALNKNFDETVDEAAKALDDAMNDPAKKKEVEDALKSAGLR